MTGENDSASTVIPAGPDDIAALVQLVNGAYRGELSRGGWTTEADFLGGQRTDPESMRTLLEEPGSVVLLMRRPAAEPTASGQLQACVHLQSKPGAVVYLGMLTVRPDLQAAGIGRQLLAAAEAYARRTLAARRIEMTVINVRDELIAWYERRGYVRTGEQRPFPYGDERFGRPLRADLCFVVLQRELAPAA
jgi:ribosomal protein S18 acetylase RimI-like enzyme